MLSFRAQVLPVTRDPVAPRLRRKMSHPARGHALLGPRFRGDDKFFFLCDSVALRETFFAQRCGSM